MNGTNCTSATYRDETPPRMSLRFPASRCDTNRRCGRDSWRPPPSLRYLRPSHDSRRKPSRREFCRSWSDRECIRVGPQPRYSPPVLSLWQDEGVRFFGPCGRYRRGVPQTTGFSGSKDFNSANLFFHRPFVRNLHRPSHHADCTLLGVFACLRGGTT